MGLAAQPDHSAGKVESWPPLPIAQWQSTRDTLHMWAQIVGKIRLALSPLINHWWEVPLYVSARGLSTSAIPYEEGIFEIEFDFLAHQLLIQTSTGARKAMPLAPKTVADFYRELMGSLRELGIAVKIWTMPVEIPNPIRFEDDNVHCSYDPEYANRFWRVLVLSATALTEFRARFIGKSSPVHFFWGSFDLAVSRFSGRRAPSRPGADRITREAYSHEVMSVGFWPGTGDIDAVFYAYAAPEPAGFSQARVSPEAAFYNKDLSEFLLPYESVRKAPSPKDAVLSFAQSTYDAGAALAHWDRENLEREPHGLPHR